MEVVMVLQGEIGEKIGAHVERMGAVGIHRIAVECQPFHLLLPLAGMRMAGIEGSSHGQHIGVPAVFLGFRIALIASQHTAREGIVGLGFYQTSHVFIVFFA